ncbi:hypothetical protein B7463_g10774, partial [Scytalidium lignicola]
MLTNQTQAGNLDATQDLYGLGVRVGLYLQGFGLFIYYIGEKKTHGNGLLASSSIIVSTLVSWFVFASRKLFSPCEAIIVLLIIMSYSLPAKGVLLNRKAIIDNIVGLTLLEVGELGMSCALIWTFAKLIYSLPTLQTSNVIFFSGKVHIHGGFRYLALVYCIIDGITAIVLEYKILRVYLIVCKNNSTELSEAEMKKVRKVVAWTAVHTSVEYITWITWIWMILTIELTIKWNRLSPSTNLHTAGELVPFVTGIIIFIDSSRVAGYRAVVRIMNALSAFGKMVIRFITAAASRAKVIVAIFLQLTLLFVKREVLKLPV